MGSVESIDDTSHKTYSEIVIEAFPQYLAMGMSYDQYWNGESDLTIYYRQAEKIKFENENTKMWLAGLYFYDALCKVTPALNAWKPKQPQAYPEKPYDMTSTPEQREEKAQNRVKQKMHEFMISHNSSMAKKETEPT